MHNVDLIDSDGWTVSLYGRQPITGAPAPGAVLAGSHPAAPLDGAHLRWHPLRGEWIWYVAPDEAPLSLPDGAYDMAVFAQRGAVADARRALATTSLFAVPTAPAACLSEVLVYGRAGAGSLAQLPLAQLELLLHVWADRSARAAAMPHVRYVTAYEQHDPAARAGLPYACGQLHGYPFIPPVAARSLRQENAYFREHRRSLPGDLVQHETSDGVRVLYADDEAIAFVPACARYPYEVWVLPVTDAAGFEALSAQQRSSMARAVHTVLRKYEGLWQRPFPYVMAWYQAPTDGADHPETRLRAEFYPLAAPAGRTGYPRGAELADGVSVLDVLPEAAAQQLQKIAVDI